ncbi:MAG TPA: TetR/AcrR family transcriptional regulator [Dongiaceae bacterium]|nr:TetR/AcrR family transcriptional regulator [Dongiaceae bacterium]
MARPREFDEAAAMNAAIRRFWAKGYEATSVRDLADDMGITCASLYNAFGDKRTLYRKALDHYVENGLGERLRRYQRLAPRKAIATFFADSVTRSLDDPARRGCMLVNAALDVAPHDPELRRAVSDVLARIESFFRRCIAGGQKDGSITTSQAPKALAEHLLGVHLGLRVLARVRPERAALEGVIRPALAMLAPERAAGRRGVASKSKAQE